MKTTEEIFDIVNQEVYKLKKEDTDLVDYESALLKLYFQANDKFDESELTIITERNPINPLFVCNGFYYDEGNNAVHLYFCSFVPREKLSRGNYNFYQSTYELINKNIKEVFDFSFSRDFVGKFSIGSDLYDLCELLFEKNNENSTFIAHVMSNMDTNECSERNKNHIIIVNNTRITLDFYGCKDFYGCVGDLYNDETDFDVGLQLMQIEKNDDFDIYIGGINGSILARQYKIKGKILLENNVRSFLQLKGEVNKGIKETIKFNPIEFAAYNNGLTTVAVGCKISERSNNFVVINKLIGWKIVNGGQTTATLSNCFEQKDADLNWEKQVSKVTVPFKLIIIKNNKYAKELISYISTYSNTQTAVSFSDRVSNDPFYIKYGKLAEDVVFKSLSINDGKPFLYYFERMKGQYDTDAHRSTSNGYSLSLNASFINKHPREMIIKRSMLAKSILSWEQMPNIVCLGNEKNFSKFDSYAKNQIDKLDVTYYQKTIGCLILYKTIDSIILKLSLPFKQCVLAYTLAYLSYYYNKKIDLLMISRNQKISFELNRIIQDVAEDISNIVNNPPIEYPNVAMYARKDVCWRKVIKDLDNTIYGNSFLELSNEEFVLLYKSELMEYIEDDDNFKNPNVWSQLLTWDEKYPSGYFSTKLKTFLRHVHSVCINGKNVTAAQKKFAIDLFLQASKDGFIYREA